jgi:hypothetical protein
VSPYDGWLAKDTFNPSWTSETTLASKVDSIKTKSTPETDGARLFYRLDWTGMNESINTQTQNVQQRMDNIVNQTYADYTEGEINTSDLVSPLQLTRSYSPTDDAEYGTFTIATLTSAGYAAPTNLSNTKTMNVSVEGTELQGTLLSDGLPSSGNFDLNTSYNTTNLAGVQYLQTSDGLVDLNKTYAPNKSGATFEITGVVGSDGAELNTSSIEYSDPEYTSTNISDYKEVQEELRKIRAEIDARQANLSSGGSSGPVLGGIGIPDLGLGLTDGQRTLVVIGAAAVVLILLSRD